MPHGHISKDPTNESSSAMPTQAYCKTEELAMPSNKMVLLFVFQSSPDFCVELLVSNARISDPSRNVILDI